MSRWTLVIGFAAALMTTSAFGRPIQIYSYERLFKEADLVVIAAALETKESDKAEKLFPNNNDFVGVNTKFEVRHTLKGSIDEETLQMLHFKYSGEQPVVNAPILVEFTFDTERHHIPGLSRTPEYMLFLKRMKDGRYEPVAGQVDSVLSVRKITPAPDELSKTLK